MPWAAVPVSSLRPGAVEQITHREYIRRAPLGRYFPGISVSFSGELLCRTTTPTEILIPRGATIPAARARSQAVMSRRGRDGLLRLRDSDIRLTEEKPKLYNLRIRSQIIAIISADLYSSFLASSAASSSSITRASRTAAFLSGVGASAVTGVPNRSSSMTASRFRCLKTFP